jgi:hypothetical protein
MSNSPNHFTSLNEDLTLWDIVKVSTIGVKKLTALLSFQRTCEITRVFSPRQAATHLADEMHSISLAFRKE